MELNFYKVIDSAHYQFLPKSKKIKYLIEKDVFSIRKDIWYNHDYFSMQNIDLDELLSENEILNDFTVELNSSYKFKKYSIFLNPLIIDEVYNFIISSIKNSLYSQSISKEINLHLAKCKNNGEKFNFLRLQLDNIDVFLFQSFHVEFDNLHKELWLAPETGYELLSHNSTFIFDWLSGKLSPHVMFQTYPYPNLGTFVSEYKQYLLYDYCLTKFIELSEVDNTIDKLKPKITSEKEPLSPFEVTYLFQELGLTTILEDVNLYSQNKVAEIISKITGKDFRNIKRHISSLSNTSKQGSLHSKKMKALDEFIKKLNS